MEHSKELQCIKVAAEARVADAKIELADLRENPPSFESPLAGFAWDFKWKDDTAGRRNQVLLMPVAVLVVSFLALMIPVFYCINFFEIWQRKHELKKTIKTNTSLVDPQYPAQKTIESLWRLHGCRVGMEEEALLLERWIEILYGTDAAQELNLYDRLRGIMQSRIRGDIAYYSGESDVHCHFGPPVEALISQLSDEFPNYGSKPFEL